MAGPVAAPAVVETPRKAVTPLLPAEAPEIIWAAVLTVLAVISPVDAVGADVGLEDDVLALGLVLGDALGNALGLVLGDRLGRVDGLEDGLSLGVDGIMLGLIEGDRVAPR